MAAIDHCLYVETVIRGYHSYLLNHELTLGEVCTVESDPNGLVHHIYCMKLVAPNGQTVGHVPKFMSKLCFLFTQDGGELDGEIIGKRFNAGTGLGVEVPIELRFVGNQKHLQKLSPKIKAVVTSEMEKNDDSCAKLFLSQHGISEVKPLQDN